MKVLTFKATPTRDVYRGGGYFFKNGSVHEVSDLEFDTFVGRYPDNFSEFVEEKAVDAGPDETFEEVEEEATFETVTKKQIQADLKTQGIEYSSKDNKTKLWNLLTGE